MNFIPTTALPGTLIDPRYPDSDGRFMGETHYHNQAMSWLRDALEDYFAGQPVYVATNLIYYFKEGDPRGRRDPDVLVARGVGTHWRRSYRIWEEKVIPCTLFEIASRRTWRVDLGEKRELYAALRVKEYFVFDPEACYITPILQGFRTRKQQSLALNPADDGSLVSRELGLRLVPEGPMLRLIDLQSGRPIPTRGERAEQERQRAEHERQRAEHERQQADQERRRNEELQAENQRLRALLKKGRKP